MSPRADARGAKNLAFDQASGAVVFPPEDGSQRSPEAVLQKILRKALARASLVDGCEHVCRWCGHEERQIHNEQRYCPKCLKRTNGTDKPLAQPHGRSCRSHGPQEVGDVTLARAPHVTAVKLPVMWSVKPTTTSNVPTYPSAPTLESVTVPLEPSSLKRN